MAAGLGSLRLVNPARQLPRAEEWMAHGSHNVLESAATFGSTLDAAADLHFLVGTTNRYRCRNEKRLTPRQTARRLLKAASSGLKAGILFGSERSGLSNADLELCDAVSTIPTAAEYPAVNLAQAVMIYAYELFLASGAASRFAVGKPMPAVKQEKGRAWRQMAAVIQDLRLEDKHKAENFLRPHIFRASKSELRFFNALYVSLRKFGIVREII